MCGGTIQQTRHTVTAQGQENGMTNSELNGQLGHSAKGSLKHYLKAHQIPKDVNHIHIIQEFGILNILRCLIYKSHTMVELVNSAEVSFKPAWNTDMDNKQTTLVLNTIGSGVLTLWSVEDEKRYQTLLSKESKGRWEILDGVNTKVEVTSEMFSTELKELIEKKAAIINDFYVKEKKNSGAKKAERTRRIKELKAWYNSELNIAFTTEKTPTEETAGASS